MKLFLPLGLLAAGAAAALAPVRAAEPPLLAAAVQRWEAGKEDWAFTQTSRPIGADGRPTGMRVERYDPSLPDDRRWQLLEVDGRPPPPTEREAWERRKNGRPRKHANRTAEDLFDFEHATVAAAEPASVTYAVALRPEAARLIQVDKLLVKVTVGRRSGMIERVTAGLREPIRVALGLARITDVDVDMHFHPDAAQAGAAEDRIDAEGAAHVALSALGSRIDYEWTDFKRVDPYRRGSASPSPSASPRPPS